MTLEAEYILVAVLALLWLDILVILRTLANKTSLVLSEERRTRELAELAHLFEIDSNFDKKKVRRLFDNYLHLKQSIVLPENERRRILLLAGAERIEPVLARRIKYWNRYGRMEATLGLSLIGSDSARNTLEKALDVEKDYPAKLFIANALSEIGDIRSLPALTESLLGAHRWYRDKVNMLIASFGLEANEYLHTLFIREEGEIIEMLLDVSSQCICEDLRKYLLSFLEKGQESIERLSASVRGCPEKSCAFCVHGKEMDADRKRICKYKGTVAPDFKCWRWRLLVTGLDPAANHHRMMIKAAENLEKNYSSVLNDPCFLEHGDVAIREIAVRSLGSGKDEEHIVKLIGYLKDESTALAARIGLLRILTAHPRLISSLVDVFEGAEEEWLQQQLAEVLAGRIEYFIAKLSTSDKERTAKLIRGILHLGKVSETIEFLKLNRDRDIEAELVAIIVREAGENENLRTECGLYLPERILELCGIERILPQQNKREEKKDSKMVRSLYFITAFALFFFPLLYVLRYYDKLSSIPIVEHLKIYVVDFNYGFAWYSIAVNAIYIILLCLSVIKVRSSTRLWNLKTMSMLFKSRMLPSVSIIAPAYNEEKTIIESANSLLNLKYPEYEFVVVNDGSKDKTLDTLISYYGLTRTDYYFVKRLKTAPVKGIYQSPLYPRLVVVDKVNGGKGDSLNAGINVATKEYFCGIDADSLLEPDALLKVAALTLNFGVETPAIGGNVFPINGCSVDRGKLTKIALPKHPLAQLQTIEYLRAFMCGRLGWAQLNSLLIISGAFGLFRRERIIGIGGYLTSNERYGRDTVGEDMELVVRVSRLMREKKQKYRIEYAYNANCWTEVPESLKVLKRQRDRWHRGLIDIMFFHRKVIFNPLYGKMGLLGMPYFLIFEMVGPLFEIQGYLMLVLAAVFGLISVKLALLLFFSTVMMGIFISMSSILIAERQLSYFNYRDTLKMLAIALLENFGPRQIFSMWRLSGFFSAMKKPKGWGKMERKGFAPAAAPGAGGQPGARDGKA
ncbi:MAG: glycosyltransferase [Spirochaetes bacterium]|nr:glycosyltransferase [Spirochaetota bacterium]